MYVCTQSHKFYIFEKINLSITTKFKVFHNKLKYEFSNETTKYLYHIKSVCFYTPNIMATILNMEIQINTIFLFTPTILRGLKCLVPSLLYKIQPRVSEAQIMSCIYILCMSQQLCMQKMSWDSQLISSVFMNGLNITIIFSLYWLQCHAKINKQTLNESLNYNAIIILQR